MITAFLTAAVFYVLVYDKISGGYLLAASILAGIMVLAAKKNGHSHGSLSQIDVCSQFSPLNRWHTGLKIIFTFAVIFFCIWANSIGVSVFIILSLGFVTVKLGKVNFVDYVLLLSIPFVFIILGTIALLVEISVEPLGYFNIPVLRNYYLCFTQEGRKEALSLFFRAFGSVSALYFLSLSTPLDRIITCLRKWHMPELMIELMYLIYSYIFIIFGAYGEMKVAADSRLGNINIIASYRTFFGICLNLFFVSFKKASDSFTALESRCAGGRICFLEEEEKLELIHGAVCIAFVILVMLIYLWEGR